MSLSSGVVVLGFVVLLLSCPFVMISLSEVFSFVIFCHIECCLWWIKV